jgi:dipeptidyl aminopeptidase/acylaminoacyl peptidase
MPAAAPSPAVPPTVAPYGTWRSPITAARVAAGVRPLSAPRIDGERVRWLEGLPEEGGRVVVVERGPDGARRVLTPAPFNVRTRVHEYGGGAWVVDGDTLWFSNYADNLVYQQDGEAAPRALTSDGSQRHADFELDLPRRRLVAVREDHSGGGEPVNSLVALPLDGGPATTLVSGHDFYASPRLSPEGRRLAWLAWRHPQMPWEGTELWIAAIADDGTLIHARCVAGGPDESVMEPRWSPDGRLYAVSDRSGFWNLHRLDQHGLVPVLPMAAEFGQAHWTFAPANYGFDGPHAIVAACRENARSRLLRIDLHTGGAVPVPCAYDDINELRLGPGFLVMLAGTPGSPECVVRLGLDGDEAGGAAHVLACSAEDVPPPALVSVPRAVSFPSANGRTAHGFHYPPHNAGYAAPAGERPPLIVISHGGPTSMAHTTLRLPIQFWTSRGFAVLDVNYGGSTGYGRAYRELLTGQWGVVDVEDCVAGARHLAAQGLVDGARMAIRGGSAGGLTTLCALAFHDVFRAGASYYGVSDLRALDADTHKFESRYTADLLGPPEVREALYAQRSPVQHAHRLSCPVIFFQGLDDKVVLPAQSEVMVAALRERGIPVEYHAFEGEGHGFRRKESLQTAMEAELAFYAKVFGFTPE